LVVTRLDRLSRSTSDLLEIASELQEKNVALEVMKHSINTSTPEGKLFSTMVPALAEFEHPLMVARTKDGLATARAQTT
jgi:DNA invertase Pin-like site-specific DNA recombinase